ncbi:MAG: TIGR02647 family protein, partial [Gammaproteobacteria bacterium]|nr:TIGR02647 family protein [Gammaproteobacteria bacterium]
AEAAVKSAAQHLYEGGFLTQVDGGYLTPLGIQAAEHAHSLYDMLNSGGNE